MTKSKHTPTPWNQNGRHIDADKGNYLIASVRTIDDTDMANAAFIVKACNAHDMLLNALQKCLEAANAHECKALHSGKLHEVVQEYAREALAAAKGDA